MTITFQDGFETKDFSKWDRVSVSAGAVVEIDLGTPLAGKASAKCTIPGLATGVQNAGVSKNVAGLTLLHARCRVRVDLLSLIAEHERVNPIVFLKAGGVQCSAVIEMINGIPVWTIRSATGTTIHATFGPTIDKTYTVEMKYEVGSPIELWIDGTSVLTQVHTSTDPITAASFGIAIATNVQNPARVTIDECALGDAYIGPPSVISGCWIATAAYGTPFAWQLNVLRHFRDSFMSLTEIGRKAIRTYYKTSPPIANAIRRHDSLRLLVRTFLKPIVAFLRKREN